MNNYIDQVTEYIDNVLQLSAEDKQELLAEAQVVIDKMLGYRIEDKNNNIIPGNKLTEIYAVYNDKPMAIELLITPTDVLLIGHIVFYTQEKLQEYINSKK